MRIKTGLSLIVIWLFGFGLHTARAESSPDNDLTSPLCLSGGAQDSAIEVSGYVKIGGIDQWLTIRGESCGNPVVLFVHGGPGNPLSPFADNLYGEWASEFTLVQWDQRGSGKTFEANQESGELTMESLNAMRLDMDILVSDGLEVADFLRAALHKDKLIITGGSWGSVVATHLIAKDPGKFHFYVGLSPLVNYHRNVAASYAAVQTKAEAMGDSEALETLTKMGPPPWQNPRHFGALRRITRGYEAQATSSAPEWQPAPAYTDQAASDAYYSGEEFSFVKFVGLKGDGMAQRIALDESHTRFEIPVYLIQGEEDLVTLPEITKRYFESIAAPGKSLVVLEKTGHDPNFAMLAAQLEALREGVEALGTHK